MAWDDPAVALKRNLERVDTHDTAWTRGYTIGRLTVILSAWRQKGFATIILEAELGTVEALSRSFDARVLVLSTHRSRYGARFLHIQVVPGVRDATVQLHSADMQR